jgi:hypothetical protein
VKAFPWREAGINEKVDEIIDVLGGNHGRDAIPK